MELTQSEIMREFSKYISSFHGYLELRVAKLNNKHNFNVISMEYDLNP